MISNTLAIAGSDPSGGAGIQADIKSISAQGSYAMAVVTALTAQNTQGVDAIHVPPADFLRAQIDSILKDIRVDAVKIGMLANAVLIETVAEALERCDAPRVLDPVMVATSGDLLLEQQAVDALRNRLIPRAKLITPNLPEAAALLECAPAETRDQIAEQAKKLLDLGTEWVLIKGGHLETDQSPDLLCSKSEMIWIEAPRIDANNTHGTGCTLSSAIAALLGRGFEMEQACRVAKLYVTGAIEAGPRLGVGRGVGPTHHFHPWW